MSRRSLTDEQWNRIAAYLPGRVGTPGRSGVDNRLFVDAILWMAANAAHWRDLPATFGNGQRFMPAFGAGRTPVYGKGFSMPWLIRRTLNMSSIDSTISKVHADAAGAKGG